MQIMNGIFNGLKTAQTMQGTMNDLENNRQAIENAKVDGQTKNLAAIGSSTNKATEKILSQM